jgi:class 3 adenylate cyclase
MALDHLVRRLTTVLVADVANYGELIDRDEEGTHVRLRGHLRAFELKIEQCRGRVVKHTGDGLWAEFQGPVDAVRCALDVQRSMASSNLGLLQDQRIDFRIGINVGDIIVDCEDVFGAVVNVAARLEAIAPPGGICISGDVQKFVRGKIDTPFEDAGEQELKHVSQPVRVYKLNLPDTGAPSTNLRIRNMHPSDALLNRFFEYAIAAIGIPVVGSIGLGLAQELGFAHSVGFDSISKLSWIELASFGLTWITPIPALASLALYWSSAKLNAVVARWAQAVGWTLFLALVWTATYLVTSMDLQVWAVGLVGFLACFAVMYHGRTPRLSRAVVLAAVAISVASLAGLNGVADGIRAKNTNRLRSILLKGDKEPTAVALVRSYKDGLLVAKLGGGSRSEITFFPSWSICKVSEVSIPTNERICSWGAETAGPRSTQRWSLSFSSSS